MVKSTKDLFSFVSNIQYKRSVQDMLKFRKKNVNATVSHMLRFYRLHDILKT